MSEEWQDPLDECMADPSPGDPENLVALVAARYRTRDLPLERYLTSIAAQATGHTKLKDGTVTGDAGGLDEFADRRALPGGVRADMDYDREMAEEIADARNYAVWGIEPYWAEVRAGESRYTADYERRMRALSHLVEAWHALHDFGP